MEFFFVWMFSSDAMIDHGRNLFAKITETK